MLTVQEERLVRRRRGIGKQRLQQGLARVQRQAPQVAAVQMKQVKRAVSEGVVLVVLKGCLQPGEAGLAALVKNDELAINYCLVDGDFFDRVRHSAHAVRPVQAGAGVQGYFALLLACLIAGGADMRLHSVAVELELVQPPRTGRDR